MSDEKGNNEKRNLKVAPAGKLDVEIFNSNFSRMDYRFVLLQLYERATTDHGGILDL